MTTGRLRVRRALEAQGAADLLDRTPRGRGPSSDPASASDTPAGSTWKPPRATPQWMLAACLLLAGTLLVGFVAGRVSTQAWSPASMQSPRSGATVTAARDAVLLTGRQRVHAVGLSEGAVDDLQEGNTYLLVGPVGGPYEVLGIVSWGRQDEMPLRTVDGGEVVVAVGPAGGWSRGKELAMNELRDQDVEILGRRALPQRR